jgi:hypothetical protein
VATIDAGTVRVRSQWPPSRFHAEGKSTGFSCLGLLRSAPLINLPFPSCFCLCCAVALLQLSGPLPSGRETFPGIDDSRQSVCASEWSVVMVTGHIRRVNRCRGSGGTSPGSASPNITLAAARIFRMETSEPSGCATLLAEDGYPLQPQDYFEICFASPGFFSGGFRETSSKLGILTNIEAVDGKGVGGSLTGQGANITHSQWRCRTPFSHHDEIEIIRIEKGQSLTVSLQASVSAHSTASYSQISLERKVSPGSRITSEGTSQIPATTTWAFLAQAPRNRTQLPETRVSPSPNPLKLHCIEKENRGSPLDCLLQSAHQRRFSTYPRNLGIRVSVEKAPLQPPKIGGCCTE